MTTTGGKAVLRDALVLAHRLPGFWAAVRAGQVTARIARRAAQAVLGQPADVCGYIDQQLLARITQSRAIGPVVLDRLIDQAMVHLHAEQRELEQLEALDARHVTIDPATLNHTGIAAMDARADWADLAPFDETLSAVAAVLAQLPEHQHDSLDVRRSIALGILADPARAQALLDGDHHPTPTRRRDLVATLELTDLHLLGLDPVISDADLRSHLDQVIRQWAGRPDVRLIIKPVRHRDHYNSRDNGCDDRPGHSDALQWRYSPTDRDRETVHRRDRTCVHPHCTRPARHCDCDHITPYEPGRSHLPLQPRTPVPPPPPPQDPGRVALLAPRTTRHLPLARPPRTPLPPHPRRHPRPRVATRPARPEACASRCRAARRGRCRAGRRPRARRRRWCRAR
ncbi:hypothetical protein [Nocardioides halotolerans]|uniref:hypothetical protein n=1 Tax=Nocardioides halotolerans TaxID=433660 RepID=UPI0012FB99E8|nr:hypothetical protein [Nocardioides halotolerans]